MVLFVCCLLERDGALSVGRKNIAGFLVSLATAAAFCSTAVGSIAGSVSLP